MGLKPYRQKRRFRRTPEPRGQSPLPRKKASDRAFVIQKHQARRLHYDFRLELGGVLVSWALPKGPSLGPQEKRLAVHVEDHPIEYADFEGVIPEGEYGAGTVLLWDRGRWIADEDPVVGLQKGELKFRLEGQKLRGRWALIRMKGKRRGEGKENWILIKRKDDAADLSKTHDILEERPESVATGRTLETIRSSTGEDEEVAGVRLTHPDRILYPGQGITKRELAVYYEKVSNWILPHLEGRPLTLLRCPEGHEEECFFQKHATDGVGEAVSRVRIREKRGMATYLSVDSLAGIISLVQMGVLELHTWGSRTDRLERPDRLVFDLDPGPSVTWQAVVDAALHLRRRLENLGLAPFLKTTGGKGLHIVVPIARRHGWDEVKSFSKAIADDLIREAPGKYAASMSKTRRRGRIFIDYLRNVRGATAVAAFSPRARSGAPVSTPITWEELGTELRPDDFNIRAIPQRLSQLRSDPWEDYEPMRRPLTAAIKKQLGGAFG